MDMEAIDNPMGMRKAAFDDQVHVGSHIEGDLIDLPTKPFGNLCNTLIRVSDWVLRIIAANSAFTTPGRFVGNDSIEFVIGQGCLIDG